MKSKKTVLVAACLAAVFSTATLAQQLKPENAIKYRQSGYAFAAWNMSRIKASVEAPQYDKEAVVKAANAIAAIANSGMGSLFIPGSDKGKGWADTRVKPELFTDGEGVAKVATAFTKEANEMAKVAASGDAAAVKAQFGKLSDTCKGCHEKFKFKD